MGNKKPAILSRLTMKSLKPSIPRHQPHAKTRGVFEKIVFFSLSFPNSKRNGYYILNKK
jgi:hypothetical protein